MKFGFLLLLSIFYANSAHSSRLDDRRSKFKAFLGNKPNSEMFLKSKAWAFQINDQRHQSDHLKSLIKNNLVRQFSYNAFSKSEKQENVHGGQKLESQVNDVGLSDKSCDESDKNLRKEDDQGSDDDEFICLNLEQASIVKTLLTRISEEKKNLNQNFEEIERMKKFLSVVTDGRATLTKTLNRNKNICIRSTTHILQRLTFQYKIFGQNENENVSSGHLGYYH